MLARIKHLTYPIEVCTVADMEENRAYQRRRRAAIKAGTWVPWSDEAKAKIRSAIRPRGEAHADSKLTEEIVREIRASDESHAELGRRYGVSRQAIHWVRTRRSWKHVKTPAVGDRNGHAEGE